MNLYYLHDGQTEQGPFSLEALKQQKLRPATPIRLQYTNRWVPAESLAPLRKTLLQQRTILPRGLRAALGASFAEMRRKDPRFFFGCWLCVGLVVCVSVLSVFSGQQGEWPRVILRDGPVAMASKAEPRLAGMTVFAASRSSSAVERENKGTAHSKAFVQARWRQFITPTTSDYTTGLLGGIRNLKVGIINQTDYEVDEAVVAVQYIKSNGKTWTTKLVRLTKVPPRAEKEVTLPDVSRGKKVAVQVQALTSKQLQLYYNDEAMPPAESYVMQ